MDLSFPKKEKLKSKKLIERLFDEGQSVSSYPLTLIYLEDGISNKVGVSVSKRHFKKAVHRNRIKRLLRESYRHNKNLLIDNNINGFAFMILYLGKDFPEYNMVNEQTKTLFKKFVKRLVKPKI